MTCPLRSIGIQEHFNQLTQDSGKRDKQHTDFLPLNKNTQKNTWSQSLLGAKQTIISYLAQQKPFSLTSYRGAMDKITKWYSSVHMYCAVNVQTYLRSVLQSIRPPSLFHSPLSNRYFVYDSGLYIQDTTRFDKIRQFEVRQFVHVWDPPQVLFSGHGTEATDTDVKARGRNAR